MAGAIASVTTATRREAKGPIVVMAAVSGAAVQVDLSKG
jgi:hypothetical protein